MIGPVGVKKRKWKQIEAVVRDEFSGQTNTGKVRLNGWGVHEMVIGYEVVIEFNANENLTKGLMRRGIHNDVRDAYEVLYDSPLQVGYVTIKALLPLTDQFGNESDGVVFISSMDADIAEKVDWENKSLLDLERMGVVDFVHPAIQ